MDNGAQRSSLRLPQPSAQPLYAAAERWRDEALLADTSLFGGHQLDGLAAGRELVEHFVDNLDVSPGTFVEKLRSQLSTVSTDAVQVAAELLYVHFLIVSTDAVKSRTKLQTIQAVLDFREGQMSGVPDDLADALRGGVAHPGQAFNNYRWKMFAFLINFFVRVKSLPIDQRRAALTDRVQLQQVFNELDQQTVWSQMWAVEHLLFPDLTPPMLNRDDRAAVVSTWPDLGGDVAEVLSRLEPNAEYGERRAVLPYRTPYREKWKGIDLTVTRYAEWGVRLLRVAEEQFQLETDYKESIAANLQAVLRAREDPDLLNEELRKAMTGGDFNLVHFFVVDDFRKWVKAEPQAAAQALAAFDTYRGAEAMDRFLELVPRTGQLSGLGGRISLGAVFLMAVDPHTWPPYRDRPAKTTARLTKGYRAQESATAGEHYGLFLERLDLIIVAMRHAGRPIADRLEAQALAWLVAEHDDIPGWDNDTYQAFDAWRSGKDVAAPVETSSSEGQHDSPPPAISTASTLEDLAEELSFAEADHPWLEETVALLREKRQLIFQGPPGTGKTYIARALAEFITGATERIGVVQFHPSYAYEDFVAGLRPDPLQAGRFSLVAGPLLRMAQQARGNPDEIFVLIIDEINRANVPAVFGELYYLLEYRDAEITMTYDTAPFSLPKNLLIIGTMNTADRSITMLDSAMRRRFYVRDLRPGEVPLDGILRTHLQRLAPELTWLADLLEQVNGAIGDRELAIGPSFFMGDPPTEVRARRAWENSVMPTLRETFYNRPEVLEGLDFATLKDRVKGTVTDDAAD
ncbi:McrB family protein [Ornithinimicrobium panacihumi]|uniref:McrB family protein n=1 Tax=Ornithinimicrobium panacihumi TaxID=2008449 RepID=UPI003F888A84